MNLIPFWPTTKPISRNRNRLQSRPDPDFLPIDSGDGTNGLFGLLQEYYLPEEILRLILSFVNDTSLLQCRAVCKYWRYEIDNEVWKYKIRRDQPLHVPVTAINIIAKSIPNAFIDLYAIVTKKPFGKNLLRNSSGQDNLNYWEILSNGGDKWHIEDPPFGSENLPRAASYNGMSNICFVTSYHSCSKRQTIQLETFGATPRVMDVIQPSIEISEWYARRWDCGAVYEMKVELLDSNQAPLKDFEHRVTMDGWYGSDWHKVSYKFTNYGPGVRYVMFYHGGTDTQFWAGHYGSKITGASVVLQLNSETLNRIAKFAADDSELPRTEEYATL